MSKKNKNEKTQRQLEIDQLDEMLWRSSPLSKFNSSIKRKASLVIGLFRIANPPK